MSDSQIKNQKTTGTRLRAWRKSVPLKLMQLSALIKVSQGSLSDLENDKSMPSATTLANLATFTDLNIYWLLLGSGPVTRDSNSDLDSSTEQSRLYEDFLYMMQDKKLKNIVENLIKAFQHGGVKKQAQIQGFISALS